LELKLAFHSFLAFAFLPCFSFLVSRSKFFTKKKFPDLNRVDFRISSADPVAVRNALEIVSEIAARDPYAVAMALGNNTILIIIFP